MIANAYTLYLEPEGDWDETKAYIKKYVDLINRDDNGITAAKAVLPFEGKKRILFLYDFESFDDSRTETWWGRTSDEFRTLASEYRKFFKPDFEITRFWTLD